MNIAATGHPANKDKPTILIVDDTPDNIMLLSRLLKDKYNTKVANNGSLALQIAQATPGLDLILLDVMMPGLDGYETCRQLKANPVTADIPVIFLTAKNQVEDEAMGLSLGAVDYIAKPISPPILFARVATQLTLAGARRQPWADFSDMRALTSASRMPRAWTPRIRLGQRSDSTNRPACGRQ